MSGKFIRSIMVALLALVITLNATVTLVPTATQAANSTATLAMEIGTTAS
jgi:hypothetical protein